MRSTPLLLAFVAACTQYPDDCDRRALRELRVVDNLIEETRVNLGRGYAYETVETRFDTDFVFCSGTGNVALCTGSDNGYRRRPVAIDPEAERRKLRSLTERREALVAAAASCRPV